MRWHVWYVRRVTGDALSDEQSVTQAIRDMAVLLDVVDAQCWERIRTNRQMLVDIEEEMRRKQHEKQQWTSRVAALGQRR